ncbi:NAD(P)-binding protein [Meredithblackwellia eburnea MCA 4105]
MPGSIPANAFVLLTGASGFLAAHVGQQLLERGYKVRGTVRSKEKGEYLDNLYKKLGIADKWEWVIVEDVEPEGAFDEAVKGVDGIAHTASPFHFRVTDPYKDLVNPAVNGTVNVLKSALKEPKIQRIVITSSFAAIVNPEKPVYTFTEKDWNSFSLKELEEKKGGVDAFHAYRASKTLAEKAAWDFVEEHTVDGKAPFDIATINPPLIFGPVIHEIKNAASLNTSVGAFYSYLLGEKKDDDALTPLGSAVDVRDVAKLHIDALATPEASNKRFVAAATGFYYQKSLDIIHKPEHAALLAKFPKAIKGHPGAEAPVQNVLDAGRAKSTFGWTPIDFDKTIVDMAESLAERQKEW